MVAMTAEPLSALSIQQIDARDPGLITLTLNEHLRCPHCGRTGNQWGITLAPTTIPPQKTRNRRVEDPGG
jgi:hypothetical protein